MTKNIPISEHSIALWLVSVYGDPQRKVSIPSVYNYAKVASALMTQMGIERETGELRNFKKVLVKLGALIPEKQAIPIEKDEVYRFFNSPAPLSERMVVFLGWKLAARSSDLCRLRTENIHYLRRGRQELMVCMWRPGPHRNARASGRLKNQGGKIIHCVLAMEKEQLQEVKLYLAGKEWVTDLDSQALTQVVAKIRPELTSHSLRRGALTYLLTKGVELDQIVKMARHTQPSDIPTHTAGYLATIPLALALGTHRVTKLL